MGASNALDAFRLYAGKVPPLSMNVLAYMALVSMDRDKEPHFWLGHRALAVHCLGRDEASIDDSDLRAVRRAVTSLFKAGAITVARHSSGRGERGGRASYRLHLTVPAQDGKCPVENQGGHEGAADGNRPVDTASTGRNVAEHRTECDRAPDENRPAKEYEETEELEETQEYSLLSLNAVPVGAREARDGPDREMSARVIASPLMAVVPAAGSPSARAAPQREDGESEEAWRNRLMDALMALAREQTEVSLWAWC